MASKSAMPPKATGLGLQPRLIPRTTSAVVTGRGGFEFHMTPLRMVTVCLRPLSLTTGMPVARSGAGWMFFWFGTACHPKRPRSIMRMTMMSVV